MQSQSALPLYSWLRVLPWTVMAWAPASAIRQANSTQFTESSLQPRRIFTVTGTSDAIRAAATRSAAVFISFIRAEPAPVFTTLGTGQPMFRSITSGRKGSSSFTACWMNFGSLPNSCSAIGRSWGVMVQSSVVLVSL